MSTKRNPWATPGQKVVGLYSLLLFTGKAYSLGQLAGMFQCSKQTILRMIEQIELSHRLAVETWVEEKERYYRARTPERMANVTLSVEEIQSTLR